MNKELLLWYIRVVQINQMYVRHCRTVKELEMMDELEPEIRQLSQHKNIHDLLETVKDV